MSISRPHTRRFLLQYLYACSIQDLPADVEAQLSTFEVKQDFLDRKYFDHVLKLIQSHEVYLLGWIQKFSPRFDLSSLPIVHIIILLIAASEIIYWSDEIPLNVAMNEAIELGKKYSDDSAKSFINGVLNSLKDMAPVIKDGRNPHPEITPLIFSHANTPKLPQ